MERANAEKPHMGLTSWEQYPNGKIQKYDVSIAKNYLSREELQALERIVTCTWTMRNTRQAAISL